MRNEQLIDRIRAWILKHKKIIVGGLILLAVIFVCGSVFIIYRQQVKLENSNEFYKLVLHDLIKLEDATAVTDRLIEYASTSDDLLGTKRIFDSYSSLLALNNAIVQDNTAAVRKVLAAEKLTSSDQLLNDMLYISKAKAYLKLGEYDTALSMASSISIANLEDLQLFTLTQIYMTQGDHESARRNINLLQNKYKQSGLTEVAKNYLYLINED